MGGDQKVIDASESLRNLLLEPGTLLEQILSRHYYGASVISYIKRNVLNDVIERQTAINSTVISFSKIYSAMERFQGSLYHQKHAFYFRKVKKWVACIWVSSKILICSGY